MRIVSQIQPLIFCFKDVDRLLLGLSRLKNGKTALSLYREKYYLTVYCPLASRNRLLRDMGEYGHYVGLGVVLDAFIAEHGKRIGGNLKLSNFQL